MKTNPSGARIAIPAHWFGGRRHWRITRNEIEFFHQGRSRPEIYAAPTLADPRSVFAGVNQGVSSSADASPTAAGERPKPTHAAVRSWLTQRVLDWPDDEPPPSEEADFQAAHELAKNGRLKLIKVGGRTMVNGDSLRALVGAA